MSSVKAYPLIVIIFLVAVVFTGIITVGEQSITNSNLDNKSKKLIVDLSGTYDENFQDLNLQTGNLSNGTSFQGQDPFVQQFLESKEQTSKAQGFINKIKAIPDLMFLGINDNITESERQDYENILTAFLVILIFVVIFVALFGDGRIT